MFESTDGYYRTVLIEEPRASGDSTWLALHPDLPGCNAAAKEQEDALTGLNAARDAWLATAHKHRLPVPSPMDDPLIQVVYAANPTAYFDGQKGNGTDMQSVTVPAAA